ncbi:MAG: type II secretion system protein M [Gammaproteobacteria bacterium]|nr:type II secretion system protein M [Gammaproteobacteria bacterium]
MNAILEWYEQLSDRDQLIVHIALPIVAVLLVIFAIILPINSLVNGMEQEVKDNRSAVVLLQQQVPQNASSSSKSFSSLPNLITSTSRQFGFQLDRYEEKKTGEINVWFDSIPFDKMMQWLAQLENDYGVTSSLVTVSQTNEVGIVRANVRLITG